MNKSFSNGNKKLPSSKAIKLYVTMAIKTIDTISNAKPNAVLVATVSE